MKTTINKILITLASILAFMSCEKEGDKLYLQSLSPDELIATTDNVVLSSEISQKVVLSFAWRGQDVHINDTTVGTAAKAQNFMEISMSEDFSGQIYTDETVSNSIAYTCGELNSIVNGLGAKVGEANNVFFRLGSATGGNIPYAYSNVVRVSVTPYEMDMNTGILLAADKTENGKTLYSANADGIYRGFLGIKLADKNFWLKEGNGSIWGNIAEDGKAFIMSSDPSNQWNFWFPDIAGCYYTVIDTQEEEWSATLLSTVTISGDIQGDMSFDVENNRWIFNYTSDAAKDINISLNGTSRIFNATTGSVEGTSDTFGFANSGDGLVFGKTSDNITLHVEEGENSIILYMNVPEELPYIVATNDATEIPSQYPATVDVQRWDSKAEVMVSMVILKRIDSENGIYQGTYNGAYQKNNNYGFEFIADRTWYRADANDNTKLAISNDNLRKFFFDKADDNVTSINVTITVNLNKLSWSYEINSQEPGEGEDEGDETYPDILYMVKWVADAQPYNILLTLDESGTPGIYTGNYTGTGNPGNFSFIDPKETQASNNQISEDETWVWYGKESDDQLYKLKEDGSDLWFESPYWNESNVNYTITVDLTQMSWRITYNNQE